MSHDDCVGGLLGSRSPHSRFLGLEAQFLVKYNVKTLRNAGAERKSLGLSALR